MFSIFKKERRDVALVLSSGGARGIAHIGAIDALTAAGYRITSVAGTSFGSIVAGAYAAGRLDELKQWMAAIDHRRIRELSDFSLSLNHLMKGDRIVDELKTIVPDQPIERLPIPFACVATDWRTGREVVFRRGSLWTAIRASISIPAYMQPVEHGEMLLIDGGITNPLPLDRVERKKGDLLVAVNVSGHDYGGIYQRRKMAEERHTRNSRARQLLNRLLPAEVVSGVNYYTLINQTISISISQNAHRAIKLYPPDVLVDLPMKRYGGNDYDKYERIRAIGEQKMAKALEGRLG